MRRKAYHVVVIGGGVTGLSAAMHLRTFGISRVALSCGTSLGTPSRLASGFCSGGQLDNFTRLSHSYGQTIARQLWEFGNTSFDSLAAFARTHHVPFFKSKRVRFIASEPELLEAQKAVADLTASHLEATLSVPPFSDLAPRILAVQDDGKRGAFVDAETLHRTLTQCVSHIPHIPKVTSIKTNQNALELRVEDGSYIHAEVAVVTAHLGTGQLVPELADTLVPFADQWSDFQLLKGSLPPWCTPGLAFSTNHTHEWGVITDSDRLRFGGGRYLRSLEGLEARRPWVDPRITQHLKSQLAKTFEKLSDENLVTRSTYGFIDIRPCDELPLIGPMFGEPRLLIGTGFGGQGLQIGFHTGAILAQLVARGHAPDLPRAVWPERLRSLPTQA